MPLLIVLSATHIILLSYIIIPILQRRQTPRPAFFLNIGACRNLGFAGVMLDHVHSAHGQQTCVVSTWTYIYIYPHMFRVQPASPHLRAVELLGLRTYQAGWSTGFVNLANRLVPSSSPGADCRFPKVVKEGGGRPRNDRRDWRSLNFSHE